MAEKGDKESFLNDCKRAKETILSFRSPVIVHHYDCDGISSGALVSMFLDQNSIKHSMLCIRKLDDPNFEMIKKRYPEVIFTDLGSGYGKVHELKDVVVIDHHQPHQELIGKDFPMANCMLNGYDGSHDLSASTTAYYVCGNDVQIGILGAVGDMQYPFITLNRDALNDGISNGSISVSDDILLYGRGNRNLAEMLFYSSEPYLPGITGDYQRCRKIIEDSGIDYSVPMNYYSLSDDQKKSLVSGVVKLLVDSGYTRLAKKLVGEVYIFRKYSIDSPLYDAHEFSTIINACGRHGRPEIGVGVCKQDPSALESAKSLLDIHRRQLREGISFAYSNKIEFSSFVFVDGRNVIPDSIVGIVCGMLNADSKPIIGISIEENGMVKASGRANKDLIEKGLNLGKLMHEIADELGGYGGGHSIAAGATFPSDRLNDFLRLASSKIDSQLSKRS